MNITITMKSTSAVAPETDYSWNTYTSAAGFGLLFRGKEVLISKDAQFGLRDGSKGSARLILRGEPTKVMTLSPEERTVLLARSTPVTSKRGKVAKVQGVVPAFEPAAFWASDIGPALAEAGQKLAGSTAPTGTLISYLNAVATGIDEFGEGKATAATAKKLVTLINKAAASKGKIDTKSETGALAAVMLNSSPEWKRIVTGKTKVKKMADYYSAQMDYGIAATHMQLAKALMEGNRRNIVRTMGNIDTSASESIPKKVWDAVQNMRGK